MRLVEILNNKVSIKIFYRYLSMQDAEKQNVYCVYNKIADWYAQNRNTDLQEKACIDRMLAYLPANPKLLDLGCGTGKPIMEYLIAEGSTVTGVDASTEMLRIARSNFPRAKLIEQDMRRLNLSEKFDGIIAWNSFFHLPAADQPAMFGTFAEHLKPGGLLLFTSGTKHGEAWGINGGENLYHASLATTAYEELLLANNFDIIKHTVNDLECGGFTVWLAALAEQ